MGTIIGAYQVLRLLKCGGMAAVYLAEHQGLRKPVALKLLLPALCQHPKLVTRFLREGQIASRLHHPNVVDITDVGMFAGQPYLVMEYLEGETLAAHLQREGPLPLSRALALWLPVCAAISALHGRGVVHRDLKPDNIFLCKVHGGQIIPKVLDFGISHLDCVDSLTVSQEVFGTPRYMSPEQFSDLREAGPASDQFSLAVILYQCLCGVTPFPGTSMMQIMYNVTHGVRLPLAQRRTDLAGSVCAAVERALTIHPAQRFASVQQLVDALTQAERVLTTSPAPAPTFSPAAVLALLSLGICLLGALSAWGWRQQSPPRQPKAVAASAAPPPVQPVASPLPPSAQPPAQAAALPRPSAPPLQPPVTRRNERPRASNTQPATRPGVPPAETAVNSAMPPPSERPAERPVERDKSGTIILGL